MDVISGYQARATAPLDAIAQLLGFPGKMGMHGSEVWPAYQEGRIKDIRDYCETDVLNTYLVFLRFELIRGKLSETDYLAAQQLLRAHLQQSDKAHLQAFEQAWVNIPDA
jgi:predicted PolB exonuclease-like 3'-5' exonuclease